MPDQSALPKHPISFRIPSGLKTQFLTGAEHNLQYPFVHRLENLKSVDKINKHRFKKHHKDIAHLNEHALVEPRYVGHVISCDDIQPVIETLG
jgi:hypothetical protein